MKPIQKDELYNHLCGFLKGKGVELKEGSYAKGIQSGCSLLADAVNLSQKGISRAKVQMDRKLDQMRQTIHEMTAPKQAPTPPPPKAPSSSPKAQARPRKASPRKSGRK